MVLLLQPGASLWIPVGEEAEDQRWKLGAAWFWSEGDSHDTQFIRVLNPAHLLPSCTQHKGDSHFCGYAHLWHGGIVQ